MFTMFDQISVDQTNFKTNHICEIARDAQLESLIYWSYTHFVGRQITPDTKYVSGLGIPKLCFDSIISVHWAKLSLYTIICHWRSV
jgi:hypothetical protein